MTLLKILLISVEVFVLVMLLLSFFFIQAKELIEFYLTKKKQLITELDDELGTEGMSNEASKKRFGSN